MSNSKSHLASSATKRALQIPEILSEILSFSPDATLPACGRICHAWERPAFALLWRYMDDVEPLFELLGGLEKNDKGLLDIVQPITLEAWMRFQRYAQSIEGLRFNWMVESPDTVFVDSQMIEKVVLFGLFRGSSTLFPRLSVVHYFAMHEESLPRLLHLLPRGSSRMVEIFLEISEEAFSPSCADVFFRSLAQHVPYLTTFTIVCPPSPLQTISHQLAEAIKSLRHLTLVCLDSSVAVNPLVWKALSSLDTLQTVRHENSYQLISTSSQPKFPPNGFPKLESLTLSLYHRKLTGLFSTSSPASLTRLTLMFRGMNDASDIALGISATASHFPQLQYLVLHSRMGFIINLNHMRPLFSLRELNSLELILPFDFSDDDIEEIASSLSKLVTLYLSPSPCRKTISPPTMTMKSLVSLARHCGALKDLSIYVKSSAPPINPILDGYKSVRFANLQDLNFVASRIAADDLFIVTTFLGDICTESTTVCSKIYGEDFYYGSTPEPILQHYKEASMEWKVVNENLAILQSRARAKREEEEREEKKREGGTAPLLHHDRLHQCID